MKYRKPVERLLITMALEYLKQSFQEYYTELANTNEAI